MIQQRQAMLLVCYKGDSTARISRPMNDGETADQVWAHAFDWMRIKEMYREPIVLTAGNDKLFLNGQDINFMQAYEELLWVEGEERIGRDEARYVHYPSKSVQLGIIFNQRLPNW